ncbi:1-deoxy-D-xylulose-5-phosphate synthase [Hippea maritima]|uniref:1-deoxy-D-xylulose-5-phosphate synthase n=1 Tax=Hippea maritima (strain ATCC 700847 / DSM 10411 / MH2) TaxID=760142 RepID=F2LW17_HIPMA|nr:1-deoxy-D-xylulose-5-phosphate synthase [Hippea maritima]AEA33951.1 1-deoxy-D-xylulose-5-phosphate synthase [Hippea maritima DSM 10411]
MLLEKVNYPSDLKKLSVKELEILADEVREYIIRNVSKTGGHLASSLGAVELTIALHYVFETPEDKLVWDVGHQTYAHKIITGRKDRFPTLRQYGGLSGFPKREESPYDTFNVGHAGTSISAALGMALGRDLTNSSDHVVAIIGDGSLSCGIAYEGLDNAGYIDTDLVVVVNDNNMSISPSLGSLSAYLSKKMSGPIYNRLRDEVEKVIESLPLPKEPTLKIARKLEESFKFFSPGLLFEELGFKYFGPLNGHKLEDLIKIFENVKKLRGPILIHVVTKKGKGYKPAEDNPSLFHGIGKFDVESGEPIKSKTVKKNCSSVFGDKVVEIMRKRDDVVAITAAMLLGTGLQKAKNEFPDRVYDVGIAEQHAVTMAGGLSIKGIKPIVAIYSTFLQRAYDQIIHDIALQNLPVIFAIDRAGIVGDDGETHQGVFDISYLRAVPNMTIIAPKDSYELEKVLEFAVDYNDGPVAVRYPRGTCATIDERYRIEKIEIGKWQTLKKAENDDVAILAVGNCNEVALKVEEELAKSNVGVTIVNALFVKPMDYELLRNLSKYKVVVTIEENVKLGGFGEAVASFFMEEGIGVKFRSFALPDIFIEHGSQEILRDKYGLSARKISEYILHLTS